jgi:hypothetical protein
MENLKLSKAIEEAMWGDAALLRRLEKVEQLFKAGNKTVVWEAIDFCGHNQLVMPDWLRDAISDITHGLRSGELKSFDQAFDVKLEHQSRRQRTYALAEKGFAILTALFKHRLKKKLNGFNIDDLDGVAADIGVPRNHVEEVRKQHPFLDPLRRNPSNIVHAITHTSSPMPKRHGRPIVRDNSD